MSSLLVVYLRGHCVSDCLFREFTRFDEVSHQRALIDTVEEGAKTNFLLAVANPGSFSRQPTAVKKGKRR